jgi:TetR/AcrR family transcriptional regulator, regulator of biofilm formation and stress response
MVLDQRRQRGQRRRNLIVEAAAELSTQQGLGGLNHRKIAKHAAVPLGATTYYFKTLEEIQVEAAQHITEKLIFRFRAELETVASSRVAEVAGPLVRVLLPPGTTAVSGYQWYLDAVRVPEVRAVISRWNQSIVTLLAERFGLTEEAAEEVVAVADGLLLAAAAKDISMTDLIRRVSQALAHLTE